nr:MAG TPA: hypothetical protein [Inoviridae sp.]
MYQIFKKLFIVLLCLCLLSSFAFAYNIDDLEFIGDAVQGFESEVDMFQFLCDFREVPPYSVSDSGSSFTIGASYSYVKPTLKHGMLNSVSSSGQSATASLSRVNSFKFTQLYFYPTGPGSATITLSPVISPTVAPLNSNIVTVDSYSTSDGVLTVIFSQTQEQYDTYYASMDDPSLETTIGISISDTATSELVTQSVNPTLTFVSFTSTGSGGGGSGGGDTPSTPTAPYADMTGIKGNRTALSVAQEWDVYNQYNAVRDTMLDLTVTSPEGSATNSKLDYDSFVADIMAYLGYNGYSWKWDTQSNTIKFSSGAPAGSWLDMMFRYQTWDYYWNQRLWTGNVAGWYADVSSDLGYIGSRLQQILSVLANDEDLAIKDATTSERDWVKNYFNGSGDKADSDKYDKLNNTGSAFKDAFAGSPNSSIADGFTAVNDNGYEFWSQGVSDDINGNISSSFSSRAPAYVPPEQRIVDAYSENWAQIVGGYYD